MRAGWKSQLEPEREKLPVQTTTRRSRPTPGREPGNSIVLCRTCSLDNRRKRQDRETHRAGLGNRSKRDPSGHPRSTRSLTSPVRRDSRPLQITLRRTIPSHRRNLRASPGSAREGQREKTGLKHYGRTHTKMLGFELKKIEEIPPLLGRAVRSYRFALAAFLVHLFIRSIPEILSDPTP